MNKTKIILFVLTLILNGCTKNIYLEPVPCQKDCKPCTDGLCEEVKNSTELQTFYIEDMPKDKADYSNITAGKIKRCTTTCRQQKIENWYKKSLK